MKFDGLKDSGKREDMETGSRRDTQEGKSRPDLMNPLVLRRLGMHFANGCIKYGEKNFELGQKTSRYRASLSRHLLDYDEGLKDEDHLAAIIWNAMCIMMNQEFVERGIYPASLDDHSDYRDHDGFYETVGKRAKEFNDNLRREEAETCDPSDEILPIETCVPRIHPVTYITTENGYRELIAVPDEPVCYGVCYPEDNIRESSCDSCPNKDECDTHECHACGFFKECRRVLHESHDKEPLLSFCQADCPSIETAFNEWPCDVCTRNDAATASGWMRSDMYGLED